MQKLMGLVQYAPEEEQNELATLLAKAASTKTVQRKVTDENKLAERGSITFTQKELSQMSDDTRKLFIYNNNIVRYRFHNGYTTPGSAATDTTLKSRPKTSTS